MKVKRKLWELEGVKGVKRELEGVMGVKRKL